MDKNIEEKEESLPVLTISETMIIPESLDEEDDDDGLIPPSPEEPGSAQRLHLNSPVFPQRTGNHHGSMYTKVVEKAVAAKKISFSQESSEPGTPIQTTIQISNYVKRNLDNGKELDKTDDFPNNNLKRARGTQDNISGSSETTDEDNRLSPKRRKEEKDESSTKATPSSSESFRTPGKSTLLSNNGSTRKALLVDDNVIEFGHSDITFSPELSSSKHNISQMSSKPKSSLVDSNNEENTDWHLRLTGPETEPQVSIEIDDNTEDISQENISERKCSTGEPPKSISSSLDISHINQSNEDLNQVPPILTPEEPQFYIRPIELHETSAPFSIIPKASSSVLAKTQQENSFIPITNKPLGSSDFNQQNSSSDESHSTNNALIKYSNIQNENISSGRYSKEFPPNCQQQHSIRRRTVHTHYSDYYTSGILKNSVVTARCEIHHGPEENPCSSSSGWSSSCRSSNYSSLTSGEMADISSSKTSDPTSSLDRSKGLSSSSLEKSPPPSSFSSQDNQLFIRPYPKTVDQTHLLTKENKYKEIQSPSSNSQPLLVKADIQVIDSPKRGRPRQVRKYFNKSKTPKKTYNKDINKSKSLNDKEDLEETPKKITDLVSSPEISMPARTHKTADLNYTMLTGIYTGATVFAKWYSDSMYYSAIVGEQEQLGVWNVIFDDGVSHKVKDKHIVPKALITEGQNVMALAANKYYEPGIVRGIYQEENEEGYIVEMDSGSSIRCKNKDVNLSYTQAKNLIKNKSLQEQVCSVTLDNIVDGKRRRTATNIYKTFLIQGRYSSRKGDPHLQTSAEDSPNTDFETGPLNIPKNAKNLETKGKRQKAESPCDQISPQSKNTPVFKMKDISKRTRSSPETSFDNESISPAKSNKSPNKNHITNSVSTAKSEASTSKYNSVVTRRSPRKSGSVSPSLKSCTSTKQFLWNKKAINKDDAPAIFKDLFFLISYVIRHQLECYSGDSTISDNIADDENFEVLDREQLSDQIREGGGTVLETFEETQCVPLKKVFLLSNTHSRTLKYVKSLAAGIVCIRAHWINECCKNKRIIDMNSYYLPAGYSIIEKSVLDWHGENKLLKGQHILLISKQNPDFHSIWMPVLLTAQAEAVHTISVDNIIERKGALDMVVSDPSCPSYIVEVAKNLNIPIVSTEWVIQCLIHGKKLSVSGHKKFDYMYEV